jgi:two-component system LytT family sensor kinase
MFSSDWDGNVLRLLPWLLVHAVTMLPFYFVWLYVAEWLQYRLARWFGEDFLLELRPVAQLILFGLSLVLAVAFLTVWTRVLSVVQTAVLMLQGQPTHVTYSAEYIGLFERANNGFFLLLMLLVFYLLANRQALLRVRDSHEHAQRLERDTLQAQLGALKSQVNPHFLFNSLSILSSLVRRDAGLAEQFIEHLAHAYRYTLEQRDHDLVPLCTELAFIEDYAFLLRLRFADKFSLHLDVPPAAQQYRLIPLALQLLVENAVKHNQMSSEKPLCITISLDGAELLVRNTLQRRPAGAAITSTGVGLTNIRNRYRLLTPRSVAVSETGGQFTVRLPLLV